MTRRACSAVLFATTASAFTAIARPAAAQSGGLDRQCAAAERVLQDACQKSVDVYGFLAPQLATAIAGGNAVLGQGGPLGRIGRVSVGIRLTAFEGTLPSVGSAQVSTAGPRQSQIGTEAQYLGAPAVDAALGLFGGVRVGAARVGAVDALASVSYMPSFSTDEIAVRTTDGHVRLGYGARVGLLGESRLLPGVALTYLRRDLPRVNVIGTVAVSGSRADDSVGVRDLSVETQAWRVVAGKRFFILGLAAGVGQDRYASRARLGAVVNESVLGLPTTRFEADEVTVSQTVTRTNYFADLSLNLPGIRVVGEIGRVSGGRVRDPYNSFARPAGSGSARGDDPRTYAAAGLRFGF